jgi:hypothetical protein
MPKEETSHNEDDRFKGGRIIYWNVLDDETPLFNSQKFKEYRELGFAVTFID